MQMKNGGDAQPYKHIGAGSGDNDEGNGDMAPFRRKKESISKLLQ